MKMGRSEDPRRKLAFVRTDEEARCLFIAGRTAPPKGGGSRGRFIRAPGPRGEMQAIGKTALEREEHTIDVVDYSTALFASTEI